MYNYSEITEPNQISNKFCSYFSSIGQNLARQIPVTSISAKPSLNGTYNKSIFFNTATNEELVNIVMTFHSGPTI